MTRRRDRRRFGRAPYLLGLRRNPSEWGVGFPYEVPAVAAIESLDLGTPVTLLAGDNGTGKSTIVEAIAAAIGFAAEGGELERLGERPVVPHSVLRGALEPVLAERSLWSASWCAARGRAHSSSSRVTRRSCSRARARVSTSSTATGWLCATNDDLESVRFTRGFLDAPDRFLRAVLEDD